MSSDLLDGVTIVDADTHLTEPHDLWTSRAPKGWEERVPQVKVVDGAPMWTIEGEVMGGASGALVVGPDGAKMYGTGFMGMGIDEVHAGASQVAPRLAVMDELGIYAQIVYPNAVGFGGQRFANVVDPELQLMCAQIFNDAMAEIQDESGQRMYPMALLPWWDIDKAVKEIERVKGMGLRGINTNADPHNDGLPDLGEHHWDPVWEACADLGLPVNFHIGASGDTMSWFGTSPWPSHDMDTKLGIGSAMMYLSNASVMANLIFSGVLERHPDVNFVSVESGVGWIPFFLQSLDYQQVQSMPGTFGTKFSLTPTEYFQRQMYGCFWFEDAGLAGAVQALGDDRVMFETDFPHPTCLYPDSMELAGSALAQLAPESRRKVVSDNAMSLYRIPAPVTA